MYPIFWVKTITFDNGTGFDQHERVATELGVHTYFADPYSSHPRGGNEQAISQLRRDIPKGTCFLAITQHQIDTVVDKLNYRPRRSGVARAAWAW